MNSTHALIIGGGIAGLLTALGLHRAGIGATVCEAYPEHATHGAGAWLTVAVNGLDAMRSLGVHRSVMAAGFPSEHIELLSGSGKSLGVVPIGGTLDDGTVTHTIKRADLLEVLTAAVTERGIPIVYERRLADAQSGPDGVIARFDDGTEARGDLLVGADGLRSKVRPIIDPGAPEPRYAGLGNVGGFTPAGVVDLPPDTYRMVFGRRAFFGYTVHPSGEVWWFANPPRREPWARAELAALDAEAWKEHLVDLFDDDAGPAVAIIRGSAGEIVGTNQYDVPRVPRWHRDRMILVGDAAHAASPSSGQGVSMAAEDAVALASRLHAAADVPRALAEFEAHRRPRVERVVAYGARMGSTKTAGPVGRVVRDLLLPRVLRWQAGRARDGAMAWLFQHHVEAPPVADHRAHALGAAAPG